jgi:hypothetical protein
VDSQQCFAVIGEAVFPTNPYRQYRVYNQYVGPGRRLADEYGAWID